MNANIDNSKREPNGNKFPINLASKDNSNLTSNNVKPQTTELNKSSSTISTSSATQQSVRASQMRIFTQNVSSSNTSTISTTTLPSLITTIMAQSIVKSGDKTMTTSVTSTTARPTAQITITSATSGGSSYHVPRGAAAVASIVPPRVKGILTQPAALRQIVPPARTPSPNVIQTAWSSANSSSVQMNSASGQLLNTTALKTITQTSGTTHLIVSAQPQQVTSSSNVTPVTVTTATIQLQPRLTDSSQTATIQLQARTVPSQAAIVRRQSISLQPSGATLQIQQRPLSAGTNQQIVQLQPRTVQHIQQASTQNQQSVTHRPITGNIVVARPIGQQQSFTIATTPKTINANVSTANLLQTTTITNLKPIVTGGQLITAVTTNSSTIANVQLQSIGSTATATAIIGLAKSTQPQALIYTEGLSNISTNSTGHQNSSTLNVVARIPQTNPTSTQPHQHIVARQLITNRQPTSLVPTPNVTTVARLATASIATTTNSNAILTPAGSAQSGRFTTMIVSNTQNVTNTSNQITFQASQATKSLQQIGHQTNVSSGVTKVLSTQQSQNTQPGQLIKSNSSNAPAVTVAITTLAPIRNTIQISQPSVTQSTSSLSNISQQSSLRFGQIFVDRQATASFNIGEQQHLIQQISQYGHIQAQSGQSVSSAEQTTPSNLFISKQTSSPRPSILRKRDVDGSPLKAAKNLQPVLDQMSSTKIHNPIMTSAAPNSVQSPPSPISPTRPDSNGGGASSNGSTTISANSSPGPNSDESPSPTELSNNSNNANQTHVENKTNLSSSVVQINQTIIQSDENQIKNNENAMEVSTPTSTVSNLTNPSLSIVSKPPIEMSPRKKPRKQQLPVHDSQEPKMCDIQFISSADREEHTNRRRHTSSSSSHYNQPPSIPRSKSFANSISTNDRQHITTNNVNSTTEYKLKKPSTLPSLLNGYHQPWKSTQNHFVRYSDVKPKEDRQPNIMEIVNQKRILQKLNGWKIYHLTTQMEDLANLEMQLYENLANILGLLEGKYFNGYDKDMDKIHDLIKGNMQRSKIMNDGMQEAKSLVMKVFDHKSNTVDIINRCASKRNFKKREKS